MTEKPSKTLCAALRWRRGVPPLEDASPLVDRSAIHVKGILVAGGSIRTFVRGCCLCALTIALQTSLADAADRGGFLFSKDSASPYSHRQQVITGLPLERLTQQAQDRILSIASSPTLYRRLPTQAIDCDRDMFLFLARSPEVLVGIWDLMGITKVQTRRTGPYQFDAQDGSGTNCKVDLVYGDPNMHIYVAEGSYDGAMAARPIRGRGVFVLRSSYAKSSDGRTTVTGTIDCFVQIENLGADLIARTLSGLIGRSADNNFVETARFIAQVSQASEANPPAMIDVAQRLPQVTDGTRQRFVDIIRTVARRGIEHRPSTAIRPTPEMEELDKRLSIQR
ncbi:MAG: hypothetical protein ACR2NZ_18755 [Rubripirellula sp.]